MSSRGIEPGWKSIFVATLMLDSDDRWMEAKSK